MSAFRISLFAVGGAALFALAPMATVQAQDVESPAVSPHSGNWTLKEREDWIHSRIEKARSDGSLSHSEYDRIEADLKHLRSDEDTMRDHQKGQLTDNQTTGFEAQLDDMAGTIHWLHENAFKPPW
ncbi:MAG: hypothetical protein ACR2FH_10000 [Caulobacteraceae bacterium]